MLCLHSVRFIGISINGQKREMNSLTHTAGSPTKRYSKSGECGCHGFFISSIGCVFFVAVVFVLVFSVLLAASADVVVVAAVVVVVAGAAGCHFN